MKKLITFALFLTTTLSVNAQTLEAKPVSGLVKLIQNSQLTYKETGKIFGFNTTESCLYMSENLAILKNYCYPVRNYPARGYTIISSEFGMIDLYEEKLPGALKRDIQITQFPDVLKPFLSTPIPQQSLRSLSAIIEKMHYNHFPACWSTNYSFYTETNEVSCNVSPQSVFGALEWANETQEILSDENNWNELVKTIDAQLAPIE